MIKAVGANLLLAAASGPKLPGISDFLPPELLFKGTPFAINRIILIRIVATIVLLAIMCITAARAKVVPGRWQGAVEWLLDFIKDNIVYQVLGKVRGERYVPMITTMFLTILVFNLCGIIPGMNMAATATIATPLVFALWTWVQYWIAATREQGLWKYLKGELFPTGVPAPLYILVAPIQLLEIAIVRPFSLTLRLFANMLAGHLLVGTCLAFSQFYLIEVSNKLMTLVGVMWLIGGLVFVCFEIFVAALQAYVFATLSAVYISQSYPLEED
ncbi:F0F1 ATP synthase subunit A [Bifidobacterium sp. ESL0745]|uniref:F0F1 ATP synthase subunit A n=1 Tax=Bifidobacterium sp. ESL0745 TaxID=2983226 RepID=UPI0023F99604|nr:F0F1 ATP synthase subunit A [Bifidobacterium sp. ESL0745]MDF7665642.1 F0F1 ATP synthase subunit A [Bifidobacterium sp. ESL0745]